MLVRVDLCNISLKILLMVQPHPEVIVDKRKRSKKRKWMMKMVMKKFPVANSTVCSLGGDVSTEKDEKRNITNNRKHGPVM